MKARISVERSLQIPLFTVVRKFCAGLSWHGRHESPGPYMGRTSFSVKGVTFFISARAPKLILFFKKKKGSDEPNLL